MTIEQNVTMKFRGQKYNFKQVLGLAALSTTPEITIAETDLFDQLYDHHATTNTFVEFTVSNGEIVIELDDTFFIDDGDVILFKLENKFVVISGKNEVSNMSFNHLPITGKLLSSPALKKCKEVDPNIIQEQVVVAPKNYGDDFRNRPRFTEQRTDRRNTDRRRA